MEIGCTFEAKRGNRRLKYQQKVVTYIVLVVRDGLCHVVDNDLSLLLGSPVAVLGVAGLQTEVRYSDQILIPSFVHCHFLSCFIL